MGPDAVAAILAELREQREILDAILHRLPPPTPRDERLGALLRSAFAVVGESEFGVIDLFEESERDAPLREAIASIVGDHPGGVRRLAKWLGRYKGVAVDGLRLERIGRLWCISNARDAPAARR